MGFDPAGAYRIAPKVAIRSEPFGAIAYDHDTRRLLFLKSPSLVRVVETLDQHESASAAVASVTTAPRSTRVLLAALERMSESGMIDAR